jgi:hypothetical protein
MRRQRLVERPAVAQHGFHNVEGDGAGVGHGRGLRETGAKAKRLPHCRAWRKPGEGA